MSVKKRKKQKNKIPCNASINQKKNFLFPPCTLVPLYPPVFHPPEVAYSFNYPFMSLFLYTPLPSLLLLPLPPLLLLLVANWSGDSPFDIRCLSGKMHKRAGSYIQPIPPRTTWIHHESVGGNSACTVAAVVGAAVLSAETTKTKTETREW